MTCTFGELKDRIADELGIPRVCQKIVVGFRPGSIQAVPRDEVEIGSRCGKCGEVNLAVLMHMEELLQDLAQPGSGLKRRKALAAVASLGKGMRRWGGERAVEALLQLHRDSDALIRQALAV